MPQAPIAPTGDRVSRHRPPDHPLCGAARAGRGRASGCIAPHTGTPAACAAPCRNDAL